MKNSSIVGEIQTRSGQFNRNENIIVIADDDPAILDAMKMILELYDFKVETVEDGRVLPKLMSLRPKLLFLDICMSGVDGGEICKTLKTIDATKDIPVVMISASCDLIKTVKQVGADDYLAKPFEVQDLLSKVNKYLLN
jgi:DNA-binding response OmpR family regulator